MQDVRQMLLKYLKKRTKAQLLADLRVNEFANDSFMASLCCECEAISDSNEADVSAPMSVDPPHKQEWSTHVGGCAGSPLIGTCGTSASVIKKVRNDVKGGDPMVMKQQIEQARSQMGSAHTYDQKRWFKMNFTRGDR